MTEQRRPGRADVERSAMSVAEIWATVDFWAGLPWPMARADAQRAAVERLGWGVEVEDGLGFLVNPAFTPPRVTMSGIDAVKYVRFRTTDSIREKTPATRAFLGDLFTLAVREGAARLGRPSIRYSHEQTDATWETGPAQVTVTLWPSSVLVRFVTPEGR